MLLQRVSRTVVFESFVRACSHGGGGPREGEVPHLPGVRKNRPSHATPGHWGEV